MHTPPEFGERIAGQTYTDRPGVYALAVDGGKLLCIKTPAGIYLPGGGIDPDEDPREALRRECREETGWAVAEMIEVSRARQLVVDSTGKGWSKDCRYFLTTVAPGETAPSEADHEAIWLPFDEAAARLKHPADRWALVRALLQRAR